MKSSHNRKFGEVGDSLTKSETRPVKRFDLFTTSSGVYKEIKNHPKTIASNGVIRSIVSAGGCRFIRGSVGEFRCGCHDPGQCHKDHSAAVLELTPRCFTYHDRFVQGVPA